MTEQLTTPIEPRSIGTGVRRVDGVAKVTGRATYAVEHRGAETPLHLWLVQSQVAARPDHPGRHRRRARPRRRGRGARPHATRPGSRTPPTASCAILQDEQVHFRGQIVAVVRGRDPGGGPRGCRAGARRRRRGRPRGRHGGGPRRRLHARQGQPGVPHRHRRGRRRGRAAPRPTWSSSRPTRRRSSTTTRWSRTRSSPAGRSARTARSWTSSTPPRACTGSAGRSRRCSAWSPSRSGCVAPYVGGGFGSKGLPHSPEVAAVLAAQTTGGRPVKLAVTRQQMFALTGYRTADRVALPARRDARRHAAWRSTTGWSSRPPGSRSSPSRPPPRPG